MIDLNKYSEWTKNTCADLDSIVLDTIHMLMGMSTEVGELTDCFKKQLAYDKEVDWVNVKEEIGDIMFYIASFCRINDLDLENIIVTNVDKLQTRYPNKFTKDSAVNRNLENERKTLES